MQLTIRDRDGKAIQIGEHFEFRGDIYALDKLNPKNAVIKHVGNGKVFNLPKRGIEREGRWIEGGTPFARVVNPPAATVDSDAPTIKPGMVVTYDAQPGLWVVLKYQPRTNRFDIVKLGGDERGRDWAWRCPPRHLTPVDAINNLANA